MGEPALQATVYDIEPGADYTRHSEGDTLLLSDGGLLLVWSRFEGRSDHARAHICGATSRDWGASWSESRVLVSAEESLQNVMSVSLLRERSSGEALLFYLRKNSSADLQVRMMRSRDGGTTWSASQRVSTTGGYNVMNNARVVQLSSGRIIAPVAHSPDWQTTPRETAFCYLSDDGGASWRRGRGTATLTEGNTGCQEPGVVELEGGRLLMYIRSDQDCVFASQSGDGGESWERPWPMRDLPAPVAPATMAGLPDGRLVILYNHRLDGARAGWTGRTPLAAAWSEDSGQSWHRVEDIEPDPEHCYGYTSFRIYGERVVLSYYVWPKEARLSFERTTLRVRVLPLASLQR